VNFFVYIFICRLSLGNKTSKEMEVVQLCINLLTNEKETVESLGAVSRDMIYSAITEDLQNWYNAAADYENGHFQSCWKAEGDVPDTCNCLYRFRHYPQKLIGQCLEELIICGVKPEKMLNIFLGFLSYTEKTADSSNALLKYCCKYYRREITRHFAELQNPTYYKTFIEPRRLMQACLDEILPNF